MQQTGAELGVPAGTWGAALRAVVAGHPDDLAFLDPHLDGWRRTTWREAGEIVDWLASGLLQMGVGVGDVVLVLAELGRNAMLADLAAQCLGAEVVTMPPPTSEEALGRILRDREPAVVFAQDPATAQRLVRRGFSPERTVNLDETAPDPTTTDWLLLLDFGLQELLLDPDRVEVRLSEIGPETPSSLLHIGGSVRYPVRAAPGAWAAQAQALVQAGVVRRDDVVLTWLRLHEPWTRALLAAQLATGAALALASPRNPACEPAAAFAATRPTVVLGPKTGFASLPAQVLAHRVRGKAWTRNPGKALDAAREVAALRRQGERVSPSLQRRAAPVAALRDWFGGRLRLAVCDGVVPEETARLLDVLEVPVTGSLSSAVSCGPAALRVPTTLEHTVWKPAAVGVAMPGLELRVEYDGTLSGRGDVIGTPCGDWFLPPPGGWQRLEVLGDVGTDGLITIGSAGRPAKEPSRMARPLRREPTEEAPEQDVPEQDVLEDAAEESAPEVPQEPQPEPQPEAPAAEREEEEAEEPETEPAEQSNETDAAAAAHDVPGLDTSGMSALDALLARRAAAGRGSAEEPAEHQSAPDPAPRRAASPRREIGPAETAPSEATSDDTGDSGDSTANASPDEQAAPTSPGVRRAVPVGSGPGNGPTAERMEEQFRRVVLVGARLVLDSDRPLALVVPENDGLVAWGRAQHLKDSSLRGVAADEEFHALVEACLMSLGGQVSAFAIVDHEILPGHGSREAVRADHATLLDQLAQGLEPRERLVPEDPYAELEVDPQAGTAELRSAYRRLVRSVHPDVNPDPEARIRFEALTAAYAVLSDPAKRAVVDVAVDELTRFRARRPRPRERVRTGYDVTVDLTLSRRDDEEVVHVPRLVPCLDCHSSGATSETVVEICEPCAGTGHVEHVQHTYAGDVRTWRTCGSCRAVGMVYLDPCGTCGGEGRVPGDGVVAVALPSQLTSGTRLFVEGEGDAGEAGGPPGDLYLQVTVPAGASVTV